VREAWTPKNVDDPTRPAVELRCEKFQHYPSLPHREEKAVPHGQTSLYPVL